MFFFICATPAELTLVMDPFFEDASPSPLYQLTKVRHSNIHLTDLSPTD